MDIIHAMRTALRSFNIGVPPAYYGSAPENSEQAGRLWEKCVADLGLEEWAKVMQRLTTMEVEVEDEHPDEHELHRRAEEASEK